MPTGSDKLNPEGLTEAAELLLKAHAESKLLVSKLAKSKRFAAEFDKAVMSKNERNIRKLVREAGVTSKFTIDEIDPDRRIEIGFCWWGICIHISISW